MVKALRRWLEANELPAIIAGVLGAVILLSVLLVVGSHLMVALLTSNMLRRDPAGPCIRPRQDIDRPQVAVIDFRYRRIASRREAASDLRARLRIATEGACAT
jgi:hypothetical protein